LSKKDGFVVRAQSPGRDLVHCVDGLSGCSVLLALKFWRERGRVFGCGEEGDFLFWWSGGERTGIRVLELLQPARWR